MQAQYWTQLRENESELKAWTKEQDLRREEIVTRRISRHIEFLDSEQKDEVRIFVNRLYLLLRGRQWTCIVDYETLPDRNWNAAEEPWVAQIFRLSRRDFCHYKKCTAADFCKFCGYVFYGAYHNFVKHVEIEQEEIGKKREVEELQRQINEAAKLKAVDEQKKIVLKEQCKLKIFKKCKNCVTLKRQCESCKDLLKREWENLCDKNSVKNCN